MKNLKKKKEKLFSNDFFLDITATNGGNSVAVCAQLHRLSLSLSLSLSLGVQGSSVLCLQGCGVHRRASPKTGPPSLGLRRSAAASLTLRCFSHSRSCHLPRILARPSHAFSALRFVRSPPLSCQYHRQVSFCKDSLVQRQLSRPCFTGRRLSSPWFLPQCVARQT
jgi:hypothetical protein